MNDEELKCLIERAHKDGDRNAEIVLLVFSGCRDINFDGEFAVYCQEFAKKMVYDMEVGNISAEDITN